jgi:FtsZ-binding cell division protein ZapB
MSAMTDMRAALDDERAAHQVCVEMMRDLRAEVERLKADKNQLCDDVERHLETLRAEVKRLQHDIDRYMAIANEHVNNVERLRALLQKVKESGYADFASSDISVPRHIIEEIDAALGEQGKG